MNKRIKRKRGLLKPAPKTAEERIQELVIFCIQHDLYFEYRPSTNKIEVYKITADTVVHISGGYIGNWKWETPEQVTERIEREVKAYVDGN